MKGWNPRAAICFYFRHRRAAPAGVFIRIYKQTKTAANARRFLRDLERARPQCGIPAPFLQDNGLKSHRPSLRAAQTGAERETRVDSLCTELDIEHPPNTAQITLGTNGMVERFNGSHRGTVTKHHFRPGKSWKLRCIATFWLLQPGSFRSPPWPAKHP